MQTNTLKAKTKHQHDRLEQLPRMQQLLSPQVSLSDYADYLLHSYWAHQLIEPMVFTLLPKVFHDTQLASARVADLVNDLEQLQVSVAPAPNELLPEPIDSVAKSLGAIYVLEGSRLGGKVIARTLRQHLPDAGSYASSLPTAYLDSSGIDLTSHWARFQTLFAEQTLAEGWDENEILLGAIAVYAGFERAMQ